MCRSPSVSEHPLEASPYSPSLKDECKFNLPVSQLRCVRETLRLIFTEQPGAETDPTGPAHRRGDDGAEAGRLHFTGRTVAYESKATRV